MREGLGWGLFIVAVLVIAYLYNNPIKKTPASIRIAEDDDTVKCELRDAYGRIVTITGDPNDPQFRSMCQTQVNQPVYIYGYPYTFLRFWRRRRPHPPESPEPAE